MLGRGGRRKEAGLCLQDMTLSDQTLLTACCLGPNPGVNLRFKVSSHFYIWPTIQKAFKYGKTELMPELIPEFMQKIHLNLKFAEGQNF